MSHSFGGLEADGKTVRKAARLMLKQAASVVQLAWLMAGTCLLQQVQRQREAARTRKHGDEEREGSSRSDRRVEKRAVRPFERLAMSCCSLM